MRSIRDCGCSAFDLSDGVGGASLITRMDIANVIHAYECVKTSWEGHIQRRKKSTASDAQSNIARRSSLHHFTPNAFLAPIQLILHSVSGQI